MSNLNSRVANPLVLGHYIWVDSGLVISVIYDRGGTLLIRVALPSAFFLCNLWRGSS